MRRSTCCVSRRRPASDGDSGRCRKEPSVGPAGRVGLDLVVPRERGVPPVTGDRGQVTDSANHRACRSGGSNRRGCIGICALDASPCGSWAELFELLVIFASAIAIGIVSHVPGGLGVFESIILLSMPTAPSSSVLASLLLFPVIYYLVPMLIAAVLMALLELAQRRDVITRRAIGIRAAIGPVDPDGLCNSHVRWRFHIDGVWRASRGAPSHGCPALRRAASFRRGLAFRRERYWHAPACCRVRRSRAVLKARGGPRWRYSWRQAFSPC